MGSLPMENKDLLARTKEDVPRETNGQAIHEDSSGDPPDGGLRAYMIIIASFLTNGLLFGIINSYSVIYTVLSKKLEEEKVSNADGRAGKF